MVELNKIARPDCLRVVYKKVVIDEVEGKINPKSKVGPIFYGLEMDEFLVIFPFVDKFINQ
jgi:hypothetical protein